MTAKRCRWCGVFVKADTEPTIRTVCGYVGQVLAWRTYGQTLCPECSGWWSHNRDGWNEPADPDAEVTWR